MPKFTVDLFTCKSKAWIDHVVPRLQGRPNMKWLEVGSYEGLSALWTLDRVLTGPGSLIYCVDLFDAVKAWVKFWPGGNMDYVKFFDANTADRSNVIRLKGTSHTVLPILEDQTFHGAYLDGSHESDVVTKDLELLWPLLGDGAILVCDDYNWPDKPETGVAINTFLARPGINHKVLFTDFQIIVEKLGHEV